jgi:hypothetical protein
VKRALIAAVMASCVSVQGLADCVAAGNGTANSTDNVVLKANNFPDGSASVQAAGNMWNDTNGGGFPMFVSSTPSGTFNTFRGCDTSIQMPRRRSCAVTPT